MKILIVGGVAGGATAAARLRRLDEKAEITIFERTSYVSYANCGLPYFIGDTISEESALTLQTPESFKKRFNIEVKTNSEVLSINREGKFIIVKDLLTGETYRKSYDKLILSPGAKAIVPEKIKLQENIFTLKTVEDTLKIKEYINSHNPKSAVIAGGGFIGMEMAENLCKLNINTTIVQKTPQLMDNLDGDMASFIHAEARKLRLILGKGIASAESENDEVNLHLENGENIKCDMLILAIGVKPESDLAKNAGLQLGLKGSIRVNSAMQTSDESIYAVGDAVEVINPVTNMPALIPLAGPANKQGRIAADNIAGFKSEYKGTIGSSILKFFDLSIASAGINEKTASALSIPYHKIILSPVSHASYYPGGKVMTVKMLIGKTDFKILGAQIVGYDGVDKRIDVISVAIKAGLKASELKDFELSYAPPYSSAKDPVNMAGFMADNIEKGILKQWYIEDLETIKKDANAFLLDTRTVKEFESGHIEGFTNIPVDDLRERINEIPDKKIYVICQSGLRSYIATRILSGCGFDAYNFTGGFRFYSSVTKDKELTKESYPCGMDK